MKLLTAILIFVSVSIFAQTKPDSTEFKKVQKRYVELMLNYQQIEKVANENETLYLKQRNQLFQILTVDKPKLEALLDAEAKKLAVKDSTKTEQKIKSK